MKGILEFDLDDYDDKLAHKRATSATDVYLAMFDFSNYLRRLYKDDETPDINTLREMFCHSLESYGVDLDDLQ